MSEAIRCGQCRWWREVDRWGGYCEFAPPVYVDGDPTLSQSWHQPRRTAGDGCSRGSPKSGSTITVKLTEETLQPRRFEEET